MYRVTEYEFVRSKEDSNLYKFRYYENNSPSPHLIVKNWKSWSKWLTIEQIKKIIKEKQKFSDLVKGLRDMKPGTRRSKGFMKEETRRNLYLWNTPKDIVSSSLSRLAYAEFVEIPLTAQEAIDNVNGSINKLGTSEWLSRLNQLLGVLKLSKDEKKALEESRAKGNIIGYLSSLTSNFQRLIDERRLKGDLLLSQNRVEKIRDNLFTVNDHAVDLRIPSCDCEEYSNLLSYFSLMCKHIYAAELSKSKEDE